MSRTANQEEGTFWKLKNLTKSWKRLPTARTGRGIFGKVKNLTINDGTFTEVHGNYQVQSQEAGLIALSQAISHGAIHDSAERYPAGRCHPGTREEIIKTILEWINDPSPSYDLLWVYGPAGAGKSAIMQTIAELLRELYKERYAGSFFFANGKPGRDQGNTLFSTLAYQIATYIPGMRDSVNNAMATDIILPTKSMQTQIKSLIVEPFTSCRSPPAHTYTILIDGLDKCQGPDTQRTILNLIANARVVTDVPLRFLIASRPEFWIHDTFDRRPLLDMTKRLELSDSYQASLDIKRYLEDGFAEIYDKNLDIMRLVARPWPAPKVVEHFVHDASGQFVYASTVLKFVGTEFCDPRSQLRIISTPGPSRAAAFSDLDQLYTMILLAYPRRETLIRVLGGLVIQPYAKPIEVLLCVEHGELNMSLRAISSLIVREDQPISEQDDDLAKVYGRPDTKIFFCHLAFREYLMDRNRSGEFAVNLQPVYDELFNRIFHLIMSSFRGVQDNCEIPEVHDGVSLELIRHVLDFASNAEVEHRLKDLWLGIQEFLARENKATIQPKHLLRHISYARSALKAILATSRVFPSLATRFLKDVLEGIRNVKDECFRQILPFSSFLQFRNIPCFVEARSNQYMLLTSRLLGVTEEVGKTFLIDNAPLLQRSPYGRLGYYNTSDGLRNFLRSASRGGAFHAQFRKHYIRLSKQLLATTKGALRGLDAEIPPVQDSPTIADLITNFLNGNDLSDVKFVEDTEDGENMRVFIGHLCTGDQWFPEDHLDLVQAVIIWLHRQLIQNPVPSLLDDFRGIMLQTMGQMLPKLANAYFPPDVQSEQTWLLSLSFPPLNPDPENQLPVPTNSIPPYNIRAPVLAHPSHIDFYNDASSLVTTALEEEIYCPSIDRAQCYTHFLESYLINLATYFHACPMYGSDPASFRGFVEKNSVSKQFTLWCLYAYPSTKILVGLWTLRYLYTRIPEWISLPGGFISGLKVFLERHNLQVDPTGELNSWLEDLSLREPK